MLYVYFIASEYATVQLRLTLREISAMPCRSSYGDLSSSGLFLDLGLVLTADSPGPGL
jgi:hypothetical protein